MSPSIVSQDVARLARTIGPNPDEVLHEMDRQATRDDFPTVGPEVGGWLAMLTRLVDAERVFEFGSGFGYSAYWMARELPESGEIFLTEVDEDELADAQDYFAEGGLTERARFEHGDAQAAFESTSGEFDLVLIDHQKERYREAFAAVRDRVPSGGLVLADNAVTAGHIAVEDVLAILEGDERPEATDASAGIADYLETVTADPDFDTTLLPMGEGVAVSRRR
ncbi:O-methyltransferase [Halobacteriales archaeon Cl-PHB]